MPVNNIEIKAGQKWLRRDGRVVTIEDNPGANEYIFRGIKEDGSYNTYNREGRYRTKYSTILDLCSLVEDPSTKEYSLRDIQKAWRELDWDEDENLENLIWQLTKQSDPEYQRYLELREKFE